MIKTLRIVRREDVAGILEIYAPFITSSRTSFEERVPDKEEMWERIQKYLLDYPWIVALDENEQLLGYAYANPHRVRDAYRWTCEVSVYIGANAKRLGLGTILYDALFQILRVQGVHLALAGIVIPNPASVGFHQSQGFEEVGVYKQIGYKMGEWSDVLWMQRVLGKESKPPQELIRFPNLDEELILEILHEELTRAKTKNG